MLQYFGPPTPSPPTHPKTHIFSGKVRRHQIRESLFIRVPDAPVIRFTTPSTKSPWVKEKFLEISKKKRRGSESELLSWYKTFGNIFISGKYQFINVNSIIVIIVAT